MLRCAVRSYQLPYQLRYQLRDQLCHQLHYHMSWLWCADLRYYMNCAALHCDAL